MAKVIVRFLKDQSAGDKSICLVVTAGLHNGPDGFKTGLKFLICLYNILHAQQYVILITIFHFHFSLPFQLFHLFNFTCPTTKESKTYLCICSNDTTPVQYSSNLVHNYRNSLPFSLVTPKSQPCGGQPVKIIILN